MKIIFLKDVPNIGKKNQTKEVSDGFALNYLLPNKLAIRATSQTLKQAELNIAKQKKQLLAQVNLLTETKQRLQGLVINLQAKASSASTLYAAVSAEQVLAAINKAGGLKLEASQIIGCHNIKTIGSHTVKVNLASNESVNLKVIIEAE
ncbi:50S ribosomal protein L9 [Patescibacteria group bacterium]|nr:50S ribosomal protein L9 [Patescibacteria group bacterium]